MITKEVRDALKNMGAAERNRTLVRHLVDRAEEHRSWFDGTCAYDITDDDGNKIYVDTSRGVTGRIETTRKNGIRCSELKFYEDGSTRKKANGYVYTPLFLKGADGKLNKLLYGTHSLVCMIDQRIQYDIIVADGNTPICNHKNNKPWDNRRHNLEWVTTRENITHGKIVSSLFHHFGNTYARIEHNKSNTDFIVLKAGLSIQDIKKYASMMGNVDLFKCGRYEYISEEILHGFVDWLFDTGVWRITEGW